MKKVLIKVRGLNYCNSNILILNENKELIFKNNLKKRLIISLQKNTGYYLIITVNNIIFKEKIYIDSNTDSLSFNINNYLNIPNKIIFQLTDKYYPNLPIEKGEMIVWQKQ